MEPSSKRQRECPILEGTQAFPIASSMQAPRQSLRTMPILGSLEETHARQRELMKVPSLMTRQQQLISAKCMQLFGVEASFVHKFEEITVAMVFPVILRYTNGYMPPNPSFRDIGKGIGGGYPQENVTLVLAVVSKTASDHVEVELEKKLMMSHGNGIREPTSRLMLRKDGTVRYFQDGWKEWNRHIPLWEIALFPVLSVKCNGFDFDDV